MDPTNTFMSITDHRPPGAGTKRPLERSGATRGGSVAGKYLTHRP